MTSFNVSTPQQLEFICFDTIRKQFILEQKELDSIPASQLLPKEKRYIALPKIGRDKKQQSLYLYDIVVNGDGERFYLDSSGYDFQFKSLDRVSPLTLEYHPESEPIMLKVGSVLLLNLEAK